MELPVESWYNAISLRFSQREYSGERLPDSMLTRIEQVCDDFRPHSSARAVLVRDPVEEVFKGFIGSYGKIKDAPHYIAFIGDKKDKHVQERVGYTGEGIVLEATSQGLNTCWVGGFFTPDLVKKQIQLEEDESVLSITPVGYADDEAKRIGKFKKKHRRRSLSSMVSYFNSAPPEWVEKALEAARLAPSAANRQPWSFRLQKNAIIVQTEHKMVGFGVSRRLDCGIAMLHLELGARHAGVTGNWDFLRGDKVGQFNISQPL